MIIPFAVRARPPRPSRRGGPALVMLIGGLAALSWLALWLWSASPYGRWLDHGTWLQFGHAGYHAGQHAGPSLGLHVGGWVLMTAAMMLPTVLPLLTLFRRLTHRHANRRLLVALVVVGYMAVWTGAGFAAHGLDAAVHWSVGLQPWLTANGWAVGATVLVGAGLFQFSALKHRCLDACRSPLAFVLGGWRGTAPRWEALRLGLRHGAFCVGCCWALMLLMFVVGMGSLGWMLALAAVMAVEKNMPWGRHLSAPVGVFLMASGGALVAFNAWA